MTELFFFFNEAILSHRKCSEYQNLLSKEGPWRSTGGSYETEKLFKTYKLNMELLLFSLMMLFFSVIMNEAETRDHSFAATIKSNSIMSIMPNQGQQYPLMHSTYVKEHFAISFYTGNRWRTPLFPHGSSASSF